MNNNELREELKKILLKAEYDFPNQFYKQNFAETACKSWTHSMLRLDFNLNLEDINKIYLHGLRNELFLRGFNLQNFIIAAKSYIKNMNNKLEKKII